MTNPDRIDLVEADVCNSFNLFGKSISFEKENLIEAYFYRLHCAVRYDDTNLFVEYFSKLIISSTYYDKSKLLKTLTLIAEYEGIRKTSLDIKQVVVISFLSGYYNRSKKVIK